MSGSWSSGTRTSPLGTITRNPWEHPGGAGSCWNTPVGLGVVVGLAGDLDTIDISRGWNGTAYTAGPYGNINSVSNYGCTYYVGGLGQGQYNITSGNNGRNSALAVANGLLDTGATVSATLYIPTGAISAGPYPADNEIVLYDPVTHPERLYSGGCDIPPPGVQPGQGPFHFNAIEWDDATSNQFGHDADTGLDGNDVGAGLITGYDTDPARNPAYPKIQHSLRYSNDPHLLKSNAIAPGNQQLGPNSWPQRLQDGQSGVNVYTGNLLAGTSLIIPMTTAMPGGLTANQQGLFWNMQNHPLFWRDASGGGFNLTCDQVADTSAWMVDARAILPTFVALLRPIRNQHQTGQSFVTNPINGPGARSYAGPPPLAAQWPVPPLIPGSTPTPTPTPTPSATPGGPSPNLTRVTPGSGTITDASGNTWSINATQQAMQNGALLNGGNGTVVAEYYNGLVYFQDGGSQSWYTWNGTFFVAASAPPATIAPTPTPTPTPTSGQSPNNTVVLAGSTAAITDALGNKWTITSAAQLGFNGPALAGTANVVEIAYVTGNVWQLNTAGNWYEMGVSGGAVIVLNGPTTTSPLPSGPTPIPTPTPTPGSSPTPVVAPLTGTVTTGSWITQRYSQGGSPSGAGYMQYNVLLPAQYSPSISYPVLFVNHPDYGGQNGAGGSYPRDATAFVTGTQFINGTQSLNSLYNNVPFRTAFPCIVVACQCDQALGDSNGNGNFGGYNDSQNSGWNEQACNGVLKTILATYPGNPARCFCIGYSLGAIGALAWIVDNNAYSGPGQRLWAAAAGFSDQLARSVANSTVFSRMANVPYFAVSTSGDNVPQSYDEPAWAFYTGNTNYPPLSSYTSGGMAAVRAGSSQFYYVNNGSGTPDQCLQINAIGGIGTAFYTWLFSQVAPPATTPTPTPTATPTPTPIGEKATATFVATQITGGLWQYTVTLSNTGSTTIGTFWVAWIPGQGYFPTAPTVTASPNGWVFTITNGAPPTDGYSIQWTTPTSVPAGATVPGFVFTTTDSPTVLSANSTIHAGVPVLTSFVYQSTPQSDAGFRFVISSATPLPTPTPTPSAVTGLAITAKTVASSGISNPLGLAWNSGCITSCTEVNGEPTAGLFARQYGYFEINCQVPKGGPATGPGFWPAFVLYPIPGPGGGPGEIDIFEILGGTTNIVRQSIHNGQGTSAEHDYTLPNNGDMAVGLHRVGCDWQSNTITFYVDGVQTAQQATTSDMQQNAWYMNLPLSVGGPTSWPGATSPPNASSSGTWIINYVGVWATHALAYPNGDSATATPARSAALFFDNFSSLDISWSGSSTQWMDHFAFGGSEYTLSSTGEIEYMCDIGTGHVSSTGYQPFSLVTSATPTPTPTATPTPTPTPTPITGNRIVAPLTGTVTPGSWVYNQTLVFANSPSGYPGMRYNYVLPANYDSTKLYPIVFTGAGNGQGMEGPGGAYPTDGLQFVNNAFAPYFNTVAFQTNFPCFVVVVECDQTIDGSGFNGNSNFGGFNDSPNSGWNEQAVQKVLQHMIATFPIDPGRRYFVCLSLSAIGGLAWLIDNNQWNPSGLALWTAGVGMSEQLGRSAPNAPANVFQRMANVPYMAISTPSDNSPGSYDQPFWQYLTGNTNYPTKAMYDSGGMPAVRAGISQFYYIAMPSGAPWTTFYPTNADGGDGTAIYNWLFSQIFGGTPAPTPTPTPTPVVNESPNNTVILAGSTAAITDALGNKWTITTSAGLGFNGPALAGTANVVEIVYVNHNVWQLNSAGNWYQMGVSGGAVIVLSGPTTVSPLSPGITPTPTPTPSPTPAPPVSGSFSVSGGYVIDPTGAKFVITGTGIYDYNASDAIGGCTVIQDNTGAPLKTLFPGCNYLRVQVFPTSITTSSFTFRDPSVYDQIANYCAAAKIVCEFEDHSSNGSTWESGTPGGLGGSNSYPPTGAMLASNLTFWKAMATRYKNNPYVWLGSLNELNGFSSSGMLGISTYEQAFYNAIRSTGFTNIIDLQGGAMTGGTLGPQSGMDVTVYAQMTNIIFFDHYYIDGVTADQAYAQILGTTVSGAAGGAINRNNPGCSGVVCQQLIKSKDGIVPMNINEWGPNVDDNPNDTAGQAIATAMTRLQALGVGGAAFVYWDPNGVPARSMTNNGGTKGSGATRTTWGNIAKAWMDANPFPGGNGPGVSNPTPTPVPTATPTPTPTPTPVAGVSPNNTVVQAGSTSAITDALGNKWTITSGAQLALNAAVIAGTANVVEIAYVSSNVWQLNSAGNWYEMGVSLGTVIVLSGPTTVSPLPAGITPTPTPTPTPTAIQGSPGISIPAYATAAGITKVSLFDDFTSNSIGSGTSGTNFYLNTGQGATTATSTASVNSAPISTATVYTNATAAQVTNGNSGGGPYASPNGGICVLNGPNFPGGGNITIMTTPGSSQKSFIPSFGCWQGNVLFEAYLQCNPNFVFNNLWPAFWANPQVVGAVNSNFPSGAYNEIDFMETFDGNFGYPSNQMSFSGHEWEPGPNSVSGGGSYGTIVNGAFVQTNLDSNFHKIGALWLSNGNGTGTITPYFDDVPQMTYDRFAAGFTNPAIPTGIGGWPGFRQLEECTLFVMLGGPSGASGNSASTPTANINVDWVRVLVKAPPTGTAPPTPTPVPTATPTPFPTPTPTPAPPTIVLTNVKSFGSAFTTIGFLSMSDGSTGWIFNTSTPGFGCNGNTFETITALGVGSYNVSIIATQGSTVVSQFFLIQIVPSILLSSNIATSGVSVATIGFLSMSDQSASWIFNTSTTGFGCNGSTFENITVLSPGSYNVTIIATKGTTSITQIFTIPTSPATSDNSHVLDALWLNPGPNPIVSFSATITVPPVPLSRVNQFVDLWIGLEPADASYVVQPVLTYRADIGSWVVASFYAVGPTTVQVTNEVSVTPGAVLTLVINCTGQSGSTFNYQCYFSGYVDTVLNVTGLAVANFAVVELEVANLSNCAMYPSGQSVWSGIAIHTGTPNTVGTSVTPTWTARQNFNDCGLGMAINSPSTITFVY